MSVHTFGPIPIAYLDEVAGVVVRDPGSVIRDLAAPRLRSRAIDPLEILFARELMRTDMATKESNPAAGAAVTNRCGKQMAPERHFSLVPSPFSLDNPAVDSLGA